MLGAEHRTEVLLAGMQRAGSAWPAPFVGVERVAQVVVVPVGLARELRRVGMVGLDGAEAPRPVRMKVELGLAGRDHRGEGAADAARSTEPVQRKARRQKQAAHVWDW